MDSAAPVSRPALVNPQNSGRSLRACSLSASRRSAASCRCANQTSSAAAGQKAGSAGLAQRNCRKVGDTAWRRVVSRSFSRRGRGDVVWIVRLVRVGTEGDEHSTDVVQIARPDDLSDLASLGLTLAEAKLVLAGVQREIVAAQARVHAVHRPACRRCGGVCRVKDYRQHAIATLFGQVMVRLPRFRCAGCGTTGTGVAWPPYARSTPELDRLRAQLCALLTYRTAAALLGQMFPVDAGQDPETLRRHTFKIAETLSMTAAVEPPMPSQDDHADLGFNLHPQLRGRRAAPRGPDRQCRNGDGRTTGFRRCREGQHGPWGADPPRPRCRRAGPGTRR